MFVVTDFRVLNGVEFCSFLASSDIVVIHRLHRLKKIDASREEITDCSGDYCRIFPHQLMPALENAFKILYKHGSPSSCDKIMLYLFTGSNDIIEVGESLKGSSSDEEDEDDEYENDSFIVSDPEDPELLSGTGDDLSSAESDIEIISQSKAAKQAFNKQKQYKRVKPITLDSSDDEDVQKPTQKPNYQIISSDDDEKDTQKSNQLVSSDDDEESDDALENSVFLPDVVEEENEEEIVNRTVVLDKSPSLKAKQQEIKEKSKDVLEESEKSHKNLRNNQEKSPGTKLKNDSCEEVILRRVMNDVGNESVIILEPTPEIKKKKSKKGQKKSIEVVAQEEEEIDGEEAPQLVKSPLIKKKKGKKGIKNIEVNDSPKPDPLKKPQDSPKQKKKNKKSKRISIEAIKSPKLATEKSPLVKKSPAKFVEEPMQQKSPLIQKKKSRKHRKNVSNLETEDEDQKSGSKIHLVALNTRGKIPCIPISLLEELPETSPELPEITLPEKKNKKRKLQPETVDCKKSKQSKDGLEIVSLSKFMLPSSSGFTSCGFKEEMMNSNRIPRQSSIQLLNKNLKKESLKRKW